MEHASSTRLDRALRVFTDVRDGEGVTALLLALNIFLLLTAYYILKPVRDALILAEGSAEVRSYMSAAMVGVLAVAIPLYARLAASVSRRRLINVVTAIFALCILGFYGLAQAGIAYGIIYFVWIGVFNMMAPAQFWAFANDLYDKEEGERLFPLVGFGASLGAVLGAVIAAALIAPLGLDQLMLVGGGVLVAQAALTNYVDRRELGRARPAAAPAATRAETEQPARARSARSFSLVFRTPYLLMIGVALLCLNWVNTTGEYILASVIEDAARASVAGGTAGGLSVEQFIGRFYSQFYGVVNVVSLLVQLFVVSRVIKYLGVRVGFMLLPCLSFGVYGLLAFFPALAVVRWAKTAENATDYSLNNTVRQMLFLPCTREQKYAGKQVIDSFFVRVGDVLSAALVFVGTTVFALGSGGFALVNLAIVGVWLALAFGVGREYGRLTRAGAQPGERLSGGDLPAVARSAPLSS